MSSEPYYLKFWQDRAREFVVLHAMSMWWVAENARAQCVKASRLFEKDWPFQGFDHPHAFASPAFVQLNFDDVGHAVVLTTDGCVIDFTARQFWEDAPFPLVMTKEAYIEWTEQRGANTREVLGNPMYTVRDENSSIAFPDKETMLKAVREETHDLSCYHGFGAPQ